ncbi:MAG TPA: hypothetical protein VNE38_06120, partial [Ktedonobacteraceae bacterium]|nr:hypothetical protein [Ktedonobacteraceae bacterium]
RRHDSNEAFGTQYPNGFVTLDNGASFETLGELRHFLDEHGVHSLQFLNEGEGSDLIGFGALTVRKEDDEGSEARVAPVIHVHCGSVDEAMVRRIVNDQTMRIVRNIRMSDSGRKGTEA